MNPTTVQPPGLREAGQGEPLILTRRSLRPDPLSHPARRELLRKPVMARAASTKAIRDE